MSEITQVNVPIFFHFFDAFQFESSSVIVQRVGRHLSGKIGNSEWAKSTGGNQPSSVDSGIGSPRSLQGQIYSPKVVFVLVLFVQPVYFKIQRQPLYCLFFCVFSDFHSFFEIGNNTKKVCKFSKCSLRDSYIYSILVLCYSWRILVLNR